MNAEQQAVIDFWFRELVPDQWFQGNDPALDDRIRSRFGNLVQSARRGAHDDWAETPRGRLALIIVLDQFPRNLFRGSGESFASDKKAQGLTLDGLAQGDDKNLTFVERHFFYLPLMHAEDAGLQAKCVELFTALRDEAEGLLGFATAHASVIDRFGRFPARNAALGRTSTPEEQAFLAGGKAW